ncbi:MAG: serine/threonine-protein kinase, partial [Acidobacteriaceae bacterium]|nr:serine/threonine-protein kinase [Acidobacteriaceae bacterium]
ARNLSKEGRSSFLASLHADPEISAKVAMLLEDQEEPPLSRDLKPGLRIGRYEISGELGSGGAGFVYSARDLELGRIVALKFLASELVAARPELDRLLREAKAASSLNHPQIVTVYEVVRSEDRVAIAMELVEGASLRSFCRRPQPVAQVIAWSRQIAQALTAAHSRGIVHRDIKPENLMLRQDGFIKVLDFGLARQLAAGLAAQSTNTSGIVAGTLNYMSPEQILAQPVTSAGDIFSMGLVVFELLTGAHPFRRDSPIDTAHAIAHDAPTAPAALRPDIPSDLSALVLEMLAKDPGKRPSAAEVDRRLAEIERTILVPSPRSTWRFAGPALLVLACLAVVPVLAWRFRSAPKSLKEPSMTQLTAQASVNRVTAAAISPDGELLAFAELGGTIQLRRLSDGSSQILIVPPGMRTAHIAWFADASRLLVSGDLSDQPNSVWLIPLKGEPKELAIKGKEAVPSPDGTEIAVISPDNSGIWVTKTSGGSPRQIRAAGATASFATLVWSPDGRRLAYRRQEYAAGEQAESLSAMDIEHMYRHSFEAVDVATGKLVASVNDLAMSSACGLPDGRILFLTWTSLTHVRDHELWELRTDPASGRVLAPARRLSSSHPFLFSLSASNDGRKVVAVQYLEYPNIYIADVPPNDPRPRLSTARPLTSIQASNYPHAWTPGNDAVIFESDRNGRFQLYRQKIGQKTAEHIDAGAGESVLPHLSADKKWILYRWTPPGESRRLMRVPVQGGTPEPVPIHGKLDEFNCPLRGANCVLRSVEGDQFVFRELDPVQGEGRELARTSWTPA